MRVSFAGQIPAVTAAATRARRVPAPVAVPATATSVPASPRPAAAPPRSITTTVGPYATANLGAPAGAPGVHPGRDVIVERYRTNGNVQVQGGGRTGAALRADMRIAPSAAEALYAVPAYLRPVQFNLNDRTATVPNIFNTQGGTPQASLQSAIGEINGATGQTLIAPTLGTTSQRNAANDGNNIISFVQGNYRFGKNTVAVAISFLGGNSIVGSDVMFNPKQSFSTDDSGSVEQRTFDIQGIGTHELLHTMGVGHLTSDVNATMYPSVSRTDDIKLRSLEPTDINALLQRYGPPAG